MVKKENRRTLGRHLTFAGLVLFVSVLFTVLALAITLPAYKKEILLTATEKVIALSEEKMQNLLGESVTSPGIEQYLQEKDVKKIKSDIAVELNKIIGEKESVASEEWKEMKQGLLGQIKNDSAEVQEHITLLDTEMKNYEESISNLTGDVTSAKSELSELTGDVTSTKSQISSLVGDVTNTKSELSDLAGSVNRTKSDVSAIQSQMKELKNYIGDCVVRYNPEDGHFYSIYNEGTEGEVAKKLDFAQ